MKNKLLYIFLINLKNASILQKTFVDIYVTKDIYSLLLIFYKKGFINNYLQITKNKLRVYINYFKFQSVFTNLKVFFKRYTKFELKQIVYSYRKFSNSLYFLKTADGFCTLEEVFLYKKQKIGYLICQIQF